MSEYRVVASVIAGKPVQVPGLWGVPGYSCQYFDTDSVVTEDDLGPTQLAACLQQGSIIPLEVLADTLPDPDDEEQPVTPSDGESVPVGVPEEAVSPPPDAAK